MSSKDSVDKIVARVEQRQKHANYLFTIKPRKLDIIPAFANLVIRLDKEYIENCEKENGEGFLDRNCADFGEMLKADCYSDIEKEIGRYLIGKYLERRRDLEEKE